MSAEPSAPACAATLDPAVLDGLRQLQPQSGDEFLARVLRSYLEALERHTQRIIRAQAAGEAEAVAGSAHALRSASASVGAGVLARLCGQVELAVRQQQLELLPALVPALLAELARVVAAVRAMPGVAATAAPPPHGEQP